MEGPEVAGLSAEWSYNSCVGAEWLTCLLLVSWPGAPLHSGVRPVGSHQTHFKTWNSSSSARVSSKKTGRGLAAGRRGCSCSSSPVGARGNRALASSTLWFLCWGIIYLWHCDMSILNMIMKHFKNNSVRCTTTSFEDSQIQYVVVVMLERVFTHQ